MVKPAFPAVVTERVELDAWGYRDDPSIESAFVGRRVNSIRVGEDVLVFELDGYAVTLPVSGDCCSYSYYHDFFGVELLLEGHVITAFESVDLSPGDPGYRDSTWKEGVEDTADESIQVYGYRFTVEHPAWGARSAVFSFRNSSNGYYGGDIDYPFASPEPEQPTLLATRPVTTDVIDIPKWREHWE